MDGIFLSDIFSNPGDDTARLIYADWLEDKGRKEADFWRTPLTGDKVASFTDYQVQLLPVLRDHWLEVGLATGRADRTAAWAFAGEAYRIAGLPLPSLHVWLDSPLAGCVAAAMLSGSQVESQVESQVWSQVESQVRNQVWSQVGSQVRNQVRSQVWSQVWSQVRNQVESQVRNQAYRCVYGQHDAGWLSYYAVMFSVARLCSVSRLLPLMQLAHQVGWWWPFSDLVIFTERPVRIEMKAGKLAEMEYADGFLAKP